METQRVFIKYKKVQTVKWEGQIMAIGVKKGNASHYGASLRQKTEINRNT